MIKNEGVINMHILIKTIDRLKSMTHKNRVIPEFIIYIMIDEIPIIAYIKIGKSDMIDKLEEIKLQYNITNVMFKTD